MPSATPDTPIVVSLSRLQALAAVSAPIVIVIAAFFALKNDVANARGVADQALMKATEAERAFNAINVRLERIQTVLERIEQRGK